MILVREEWPQYAERLILLRKMKKKKSSVFLTVIGAAMYKALRDLVAPAKPGTKPLEELLQKLEQHYSPRPSEIVQRFRFHTCFRKPGEAIAAFIARLRSLSEHCTFGDSLEDMIHDRLVCGISEETIQKRLLAESKLTYKKAVELALGLETADKNVKLLRNNQKELDSIRSYPRIDHVAPQKKERDVIALICFRCGKPGHIAPKCKLANSGIVCRQCGKSGHIQRACKSGQRGTVPKGRSRPVRQVQEEEEAVNLLMVQEKKKPHSSPPIEMKVKIDDCLVKMEVDTGATVSLMSQKTFRQLWPRRTLKPTEVRLCSYSKETIPVVGCCYVNLVYKGQTAINMPLLIVQGSGPNLFGRNWLKGDNT